jgi:REP element-mobilizing transposase RayT
MRREFNDDHTPIAYLITFRSYGTWMHGDERGSIDRHHRGYGTPALPASARRETIETRLLNQPKVIFDSRQRRAIERGIKETCLFRKWNLWTVNVRTNHVHCVLTAHFSAKRAMAALKANATRTMRDAGCWQTTASPWSRGGSTKYIWNEEEWRNAIAYVVDGQGLPLT